ncbi:MAG TPA: hypothetical protein VG711_13080 [Phycisphaerales bacterium]|nr:hypothetical protein [Phycisphaerales bacterium]
MKRTISEESSTSTDAIAAGGHASGSGGTGTRGKYRPRRNSKALSDLLVDKIVEADASPGELARQLSLPLAELASWASQERTVALMRGLVHLADMRAQMLLSKYRANAAVQLITIASAKDATELSRRACVDLLKINLGGFGRDEPRGESSNDAWPQSEGAWSGSEPDDRLLRNMLETLGAQSSQGAD